MTNDEKLEILFELKRRIDKAEINGLDDALGVLLPILKTLDKLFYNSDELRDLSLDYLVGKASLKDVGKAME